MLIGLHEASHGLLRKSRLLNEIDGIIIGVFGFMSFSLFRAVHQSHHAHFATERDEELWPFVQPAHGGPESLPLFLNSVSACYTRRFSLCTRFGGAARGFENKACGGASGLSSS
jgi:fatty acid desaturase